MLFWKSEGEVRDCVGVRCWDAGAQGSTRKQEAIKIKKNVRIVNKTHLMHMPFSLLQSRVSE